MTLSELKERLSQAPCPETCEPQDGATDGVVELEQDFWEALVLLNECHDTLSSILKLDRQHRFMTVHRRTDTESLLAKVSDLTEQYDLGE